MARIQIELPERFLFSTEIPVLALHLNFTGHLDNAMVLAMVSEARIRLWQSLGQDPVDVHGVTLMAVDAAVRYQSQAHHGEVMVVEKAARDFHPRGLDLVWRLSERQSGREVARGKTGLLCVDRVSGQVSTLPEPLRNQLLAL